MKIQNILLLMFFLLVGLSCQPSQRVLEGRQPVSTPVSGATPEKAIDDFEDRLKSVQTGDFDFVYAFRRKDGDVLSSDDIKYFKENSPWETNQRVLTDDKKALIAGSNFAFPPENLDALKKRFKIEDYSPEKEVLKKEPNSNVKR